MRKDKILHIAFKQYLNYNENFYHHIEKGIESCLFHFFLHKLAKDSCKSLTINLLAISNF
jgi:hypothetical protein